MSEDVPGYLDTNVIIHSLRNDSHSDECRRFMSLIEHGERVVILDPLVVHELTYSLQRVFPDIETVGTYILSLITYPGVRCQSALLNSAVEEWMSDSKLGFVDAYLVERAKSEGRILLAKDRALMNQGIEVPNPLDS